MSALISVPAGRCLRRSPEQKWVDPQPEKGLIELRLEDDLLHLCWKSRDTGAVEDELIIFPGEATFSKVEQDPSGRTHILKFSSSDQKYFFWFQRADTDGDLRAAVDINEVLQNLSYQIGSAPLPSTITTLPQTPPIPSRERSYPPTPGAPRLSHPTPGPPTGQYAAAQAALLRQQQLQQQQIPVPTAETSTDSTAGPSGTGGMEIDTDAAGTSAASHAEMARLLVQWAQQGGMGAVQEDAHLTDILSPANITNLIQSSPTLVRTLIPLLPPSLGIPETASADILIPILTAPQITDAIASLDNALRSGGLPGGMMLELGLPASAGTGVREFLEGLKGLKKSGSATDDAMETD